MNRKKVVSVMGATGYASAELVKILSAHGKVELKHVFSRCKN